MAHLTHAQLLTLQASILGETDPTFVGYRNAGDKPSMADWYNADSSPAFVVWKTSVPVANVGIAFSSSEVAGLTTANTNRLQVMASYSGGSFNPSIADVRAGFDSVFNGAGGVNTRAALLALWKRTARRFERLYATGTGSDASPAQLVVEGTLDGSHIGEALEAQ
jgi:hypothetical protein